MSDVTPVSPPHLDTLVWSLQNPGGDAAAREAAYQEALARLDEVVVPALPEDDAGYRRLTAGRQALSSLYGFAFNREHPAFARVAALEREFAALQVRYNRRFLVTDPDASLVARAHLWGYTFSRIDSRAIWVLARDLGVLGAVRHVETGELLPRIIGLERAVGDNTFTTDANGRDRRRYVRTIGRQAFCSERRLHAPAEQVQAFLAGVPLLDDLWCETIVGDFKGGAAASRLKQRDKVRLFDLLEAVSPARIEAVLGRPTLAAAA